MSLLLSALFISSLSFTVFSGLASLFFPRANTFAQVLLTLSGVAGLAAVAAFFFSGAATGGTFEIYGLTAFGVAQLSAFFFGIVSLGVVLAAVFAIGYLPRYANTFSLPRVNLAMSFFIAGMQCVILAQSPAVFLMAWEVMSVAAYFLVIADGSAPSLSAGFLYFVMTQLGFLSLLAGFLLLARGAPLASWGYIAAAAAQLPPTTLAVAFALIFLGFASKAGLVPMHQWLPQAHPQAPSHSSALLSGVMLNVALYGFLLSISIFPWVDLSWAVGVIVIGLLSAFFGSLHAAVENDAKRLLAWSSIEHMGLLFAAVGIMLALRNFPADAFIVSLYAAVAFFVVLHILNHSLFKVGLFLSVGAVASETHTRDLDQLGGLARSWPFFSGVFLALSLAAAALPPFGAFVGEWAFVQALALGVARLSPFAAASAAFILSVTGVTIGFALFASIKLFAMIFLGRARSAEAEHAVPLPWTLVLPPAASAVLSLLVTLAALPFAGNFASTIGGAISIAPGASFNTNALLFECAALLLIVFALVRVFSRGLRVRTTDTWDCGSPLTPRMQYTSTGFASPIRFFFRSVVLSKRRLMETPVLKSNPWIVRKHIEWSTSSIWEKWLYQTTGSIVLSLSAFVRRLQSGVVQLYLLFMLVALIVTLIFAV